LSDDKKLGQRQSIKFNEDDSKKFFQLS